MAVNFTSVAGIAENCEATAALDAVAPLAAPLAAPLVAPPVDEPEDTAFI